MVIQRMKGREQLDKTECHPPASDRVLLPFLRLLAFLPFLTLLPFLPCLPCQRYSLWAENFNVRMREIELLAIPQQESLWGKPPLHPEMFVHDPALYSLGHSLLPWLTAGGSPIDFFYFRFVRQLGLLTPDFLGVTRALSMYPGFASQSASIRRSLLILVVIDALTMFDFDRFRIRVPDSKSTRIMIEARPELVQRTWTRLLTSVVHRMYVFTRWICFGWVILDLTLY